MNGGYYDRKGKNAYRRMLYDANYDKELINDRYKAKDICCEYNNLKPSDFEGKNKINILDMCNSFLY